MKSPLVRLACVALAFGCTVATAPRDGVRVETLGTIFDRASDRSSAPVPFAVTNVGTQSVFLERCGERVMAAVDRWADARWSQYSGDACLAIYPMVPVELQAHSRLEGTRVIREPGIYRLRLGVASGVDGPIEWSATSAPFHVR